MQTIVHAAFTIRRTIAVPVAALYVAFADKQAKEAWFKGPTDNGENEHVMDFRVGGSELNKGTFTDGVSHTFKADYYDIVPEKRIVYAYEMYLDDVRISVSLATIEFVAEGDETTVTIHEAGAFLDGLDSPDNREQVTRMLLDALEAAVVK